MTAAAYDFVIEQGTTIRRVVDYQNPDESPYDLSGFTARMMIRRHYEDEVPLVDLTSPDDGLTVDGPIGRVSVLITEEQVALLPLGHSLYDIELVSPLGEVSRLLSGRVTVTPEVTK